MTTEQITQELLVLTEKVASVKESTDSAHKRIDEVDRITEGIHKLAANMEALTLQVKMLAEQVESTVTRIEAGQKAQGERIGNLEQEPANKWKSLVQQVIELVVAAGFGVLFAKIL